VLREQPARTPLYGTESGARHGAPTFAHGLYTHLGERRFEAASGTSPGWEMASMRSSEVFRLAVGSLLIPSDTAVMVGRAEVRRCSPNGMNYRIGLYMPDRLVSDLQNMGRNRPN
jgi:hypothetical protein